jgi:hypothetical protein
MGQSVGSFAGGQLGRYAGSAVDRLLGRGAYTVKRNSIMNGSTAMPLISTGKAGVRIRNKEFLFDLYGPGTASFTILETISLNPGLALSMPYASQLAVAFEEYMFHGAVIVIESCSGSLSTTQALGSIIVASQYDQQDAAFGTQMEMLDYEFASSERCDVDFIHPIECDPRQNQVDRYYVRTGLITGTTTSLDPRYNAYDICRTTFAVSGVPSGTTAALAKVWLSYDLELYKPKLYGSVLGNNIPYDHFTFSTGTTNGTGNLTSLGAIVTSQANLGGGLYLPFTYLFPQNVQQGQYLIMMLFNVSSGGAALSVGSWTTSNVTLVSFLSTTAASNCTQCSFAMICQITGTNASITCPAAGLQVGAASASNVSGELWISQINNSMTH